MNKFLCKVCLGLALVSLSSLPAQAQPRIALIDLEKLFNGYWKTMKADANIREQAGTFLKDRKKMVDEWEKAKLDYKKLLDSANDQIVSSDEREKRKKSAEGKLVEIQEIETSLTQFDRSSQTSIDEQKRRMRDSILKEIREEINKKAKSGNFTMVLDNAGKTFNQTPFILYHTTENDLTDAVLSELNKGTPTGFMKSLENKEDKNNKDGKK